MGMTRPTELNRSIHILLVEDNPADVRLMQEMLKDLQVQAQLSVVEDGAAVLAFLHREEPYTTAGRPDLILLDLNLPDKPGIEVLAEMSTDPRLRRIPLIVLSSSQAEQDIVRSYELCADCYITKPTGLEQLAHAVRLIEEFWLTLVTLPSAVQKDPLRAGGSLSARDRRRRAEAKVH
jgi:chemotaxis family two-component system response regulator Rcp1